MNHNDYIKAQVAEAVKNRKSLVLMPTQERKKFFGYFLPICILLMSLMTLSIVFMRPSTVEPQETPPVQQYVTHEDAENAMEMFNQRIQKLESLLSDCTRRVWLLGIANNENAMMLKNTNSKYHRDEPNDYITFERDWKISRMPRSIRLQDGDKEALSKNIK